MGMAITESILAAHTFNTSGITMGGFPDENIFKL